MTAMPRLPEPLTVESLRDFMRERPYWDSKHPRSELYHRLIRRGFEMLYPGPAQYDGIGRMIDTPPRSPGEVARLVAQTNRELEAMGRGFDEPSSGSGEVHVQSHTRDDGKTKVSDYWRAAPGEGGGEDSIDDLPKPRNLLERPGTPEDRTLEFRIGRDETKPTPLGRASVDENPRDVAVNMADDAGNDEEDRSESAAREGADGTEGAQAETDNPKPWEGRYNEKTREALAEYEQSANKKNDGYEEKGPKGALGRYQILPSTLDGIGWRNSDGSWTDEARKHGVNSDRDFLHNPKAQEEALDRVLEQYEKEAESKGLFDRVGQTIKGRVADIEVTKAGIMAAIHHGGARGTRQYFKKIDQAGVDSKNAPLTEIETAIETRMRKSQGIHYQRKHE